MEPKIFNVNLGVAYLSNFSGPYQFQNIDVRRFCNKEGILDDNSDGVVDYDRYELIQKGFLLQEYRRDNLQCAEELINLSTAIEAESEYKTISEKFQDAIKRFERENLATPQDGTPFDFLFM